MICFDVAGHLCRLAGLRVVLATFKLHILNVLESGRTLHHNMCSNKRARYGAMTQNIVVATAYATLGTEAVVHAVNEGEIATMVFDVKWDSYM